MSFLLIFEKMGHSSMLKSVIPALLWWKLSNFASINELICLANMENINAVLIDEGVPQGDRLVRLNQIAINQMRVLEKDDNRNVLKWHEWIDHNIERHKKRWLFDS